MDGFVECQGSIAENAVAIEDLWVLLSTKDDRLDLVLKQLFSRRNDITSTL